MISQGTEMSGCPTIDGNLDHRVMVVIARSVHCEVALSFFCD